MSLIRDGGGGVVSDKGEGGGVRIILKGFSSEEIL